MKWYEQIIPSLRAFFGLDAEATESEIHATLEKAGNLESYKAQLKTEAEAAVKGELDKAKSDLQSAQEALSEKSKEVEALKTEVADNKTKIAELEKRSAANPTKVKSGPGEEDEDDGNEEAMPVWKAYQEYIAAL